MNQLMPATSQLPPYLEYFPELGTSSHRILLEHLPSRIGRNPKANWIVPLLKVSKEHAEIFRADGEFRIRDLNSTNGTFVNGKRIEPGDDLGAMLSDGDILHIAHLEFRFGYRPDGEGATAPDHPVTVTAPSTSLLPVPASKVRAGELLDEMIAQRLVRTLFQPIVDLYTRKTIGYEALGRGAHKDLEPYPIPLFRLAEKCGQAAALSRTFRRAAVAQAASMPEGLLVFLNIHPSELGQRGDNADFFDHLREMRGLLGQARRMVIEVHENVVADTRSMRRLRDRLREADIDLAFDDFGVGQSRLMELTEVPPDYIKLDMSLIRDIDSAEARQGVVEVLCHLIRHRGVKVIAEGIERPEEGQTCHNLGCQLGQGYLFGKPQEL